MKLNKKLSLLLLTISILPMLYISIFTYSQYVRTINHHFSTMAEKEYDLLTNRIRDIYNDIRKDMYSLNSYSEDAGSIINTLRTLSEQETVSNHDIYTYVKSVRSDCQTILSNHKYIHGIYMMTLKDIVFGHYTTSKDLIPNSRYHAKDDDWYQYTLSQNGRICIFPKAHYSMIASDEEYVLVTQLVRDADHSFDPIGILLMICSPDLFDLNRYNSMSDFSYMELSHINSTIPLYSNIADKSEISENIESKRIPQTPFVLSMMIDYKAFTQDYQITRFLIIALIGVCLLFSTFMIFYFHHTFIQPIQELTQLMVLNKPASENSISMYEYRQDEIGILYRQYDQMLSQINTSIKSEYRNKLVILDAQMQSLEARINSHFLFNTLESINSMAELADQNEISTMSLALGNMFRYAIKTDKELVTLEEELKHLEDYHSIQRIRFNDRYRLILNIEDAALHQPMLKLILQPLVENALTHGLDYCHYGDEICISAHISDQTLILCVRDNGRGMNAELLEKVNKNLNRTSDFVALGRRKKESIGLANIQTRIRLYYGQGYGITIDSTESEGTTMKVTIPILDPPDSASDK